MAVALQLLFGALVAVSGTSHGRALMDDRVWSNLGPGCCKPTHDKDFLYQESLSVNLTDCKDKCESFGEQCGFVNHGWVHHEMASRWCSVISVGASYDLTSGHTDCGSCGDCGVNCYKFAPVIWTFQGHFSCSNAGDSARGQNLGSCQREAEIDAACGDYLQVSNNDSTPFVFFCSCTPPGETCTQVSGPSTITYWVYKKS